MLFIYCKQCYVPSIGISQVSAIFYMKSIGIGSNGENCYRFITTNYLTFAKVHGKRSKIYKMKMSALEQNAYIDEYLCMVGFVDLFTNYT